jgi:alpha-beta hydrolase superfamily lysophospholipase
MVKIKTLQLRSNSGANLYLRRSKPKGKVKAVVQINHGLTEHSGRYEHFMKHLSANDYAAIAHDHRGHGLTEAEKLPKGQFSTRDGSRKVLKDVDFINNYIRSEFPDTPIICFGHSMGGLIAANYATGHPHKIDALAIWNSNFQASDFTPFVQFILGFEAFFLGSDVPSAIIPKLTFQRWSKSIDGAVSGTDWLSSDREQLDAIADDDLTGWKPSISMWQDVFNFMSRGAKVDTIARLPKTLPINLVGGGEDPATNKGLAVSWLADRLKKNGLSNINFKIYKDARHETLNDFDRKIAMDDFVLWANKFMA